ncbi:MAG: hypothetical protein IPK67_06920 [Planctomycetes bacterium]|nr:hypothetical protein [Planctomycetota bacterium]
MIHPYMVLVQCRHNDAPTGEGCDACEGSGFVKVVLGRDGEPKLCLHASNEGLIEDCDACMGSGWAGLCD